MAEKRMFTKKIVDSDAFLDMPATSRLLYYDLNMRADDDGFVNSPKKICRITGASEDDLNILIAKHFVIPFPSGVVVIKHWRLHNYIAKDRYHETAYTDEMNQLTVKENKVYSLADSVEKVIEDRPYQRIVEYLNEKTGKRFKTGNEVKKLIDARYNAGATEQDFYTVIDNMTSRWLEDVKMRDYLRPITLFGTKFDSYLNTEPKYIEIIPVYDSSNNVEMSEEEENELLALMGKV